MAPPEDHRRRLARLMEDRRAQLGLFWRDVAETAGLTTEGLRGMREGSKDIRPTTKAGVERALRWAYGSVDAILSGGDPTPVEAEPKRRAEPAEPKSPADEIGELLADIKRLALRAQRLEAERRERDASHRDDETA